MSKADVTTEDRHGIPAGVKLTPMMRQYVAAKERYPDALLFFRMGDFYEMFYADAEMGGRHLDLTVTSRDKDSTVPAPMSGFPHHQLPAYLAKALAAGLKVAVCDQLEDPAMAKGIVERGITRVVTPGVVLDAESLDARANNFLVAVVPGGAGSFGLAALDVSTGDFRCTEVTDAAALRCELSRLEPRELLLPNADETSAEHGRDPLAEAGERLKRVALTRPGAHFFKPEAARKNLARLLGPDGGSAVHAVENGGFGAPLAVLAAAGAVAAYVIDTQQKLPESTRILTPYRVQDTLVLDETAKNNLELFRTLMEGRKKGALLGVLDRASTAMGGRRLRHWLSYPLVDPAAINRRLDAVEALRDDADRRDKLRTLLQRVHDLERLNGRIAAGAAGPRDLWALRTSLERVPELREVIAQVSALDSLLDRVRELSDIVALIATSLVDDPPGQLRDGGVVRAGFDPALDELVDLATHGKDWIVKMEARERERTSIASLKVRYNRVFGYYIEISNANLHAVPADYIRKQTLANAERYYTPELKTFEEKVVNAETRRISLEQEIFTAVREEVAAQAAGVAEVAGALADLDALVALAELAHRNDYVRPIVDDGDLIEIDEGRHPVVEEAVGRGQFVPNSLRLDREENSLIILTGPNMAGKSTIMRQVALVTLMAQMGSFVPARRAHIGVVDRIFTRVGAADDLAAGRSTCMVEMYETSVIVKEATRRSLLILDEIGRGTSTYDGVSIAWAVAEHIHDVLGAKTLFATHYHELTDLAAVKPRARNYTIAVKEWNDEVVFLRQLVEGGANRSYGIQVARLAGLPRSVVDRAKEVLNNLQGQELDEVGQPRIAKGKKVAIPQHNLQLSLFTPPPIPVAPSDVERQLRAADLDQMTPLQALTFLHALRARLK
jgi:DNA mismatch repair protein MutS